MVNTFGSSGGPTWCSSRLKWSRIDYIFAKMSQLSRVSNCELLSDIDLTMNAKQDHTAVAATFLITAPAILAPAQTRRFRISRTNLQCAWRCEMFRTEMWKFQANFDMHIDDHLEALNEHTREAALRIFGSHKDTQRKPRISSVTWQIVKGIAPMRRTVHFIRKRYYWWRASMCFHAWMFARRW